MIQKAAWIYYGFLSAAVVVLLLRGHWTSALALMGALMSLVVLHRLGPHLIQRALGDFLPILPLLAGGAVLFLLTPSGLGTPAYYAAGATVIPTSLIAIAISGRLIAGRLDNGVDLFRACIGLYLMGNGELAALRALYRGEGTALEVTATAAGVTAGFATVLVAALVTEFAPTQPERIPVSAGRETRRLRQSKAPLS